MTFLSKYVLCINNQLSICHTMYKKFVDQLKQITQETSSMNGIHLSKEELLYNSLTANVLDIPKEDSILSMLYKTLAEIWESLEPTIHRTIQDLIALIEIEQFSVFIEWQVDKDFDTRMLNTQIRENYYAQIKKRFLQVFDDIHTNNLSYQHICNKIDRIEQKLIEQMMPTSSTQTTNTYNTIPLKTALHLIAWELKLSTYDWDPIHIHVSCPVYNESERLAKFSTTNLYWEYSAHNKIKFLQHIIKNPKIHCDITFCDDQSHTHGHLEELEQLHTDDVPVYILSLDSYFEKQENFMPHLQSKRNTSTNISKKSWAAHYALAHGQQLWTWKNDFFVQIDCDNSIPIENIGHFISQMIDNTNINITQWTRKDKDSIRFFHEDDRREWMSYIHLEMCKWCIPQLQQEKNIDPNHGITIWKWNITSDYLSEMHSFFETHGNTWGFDVYPWQIMRYISSQKLGLKNIPTVCLDSPHQSHFNGNLHKRFFSVFNNTKEYWCPGTQIHTEFEASERDILFRDLLQKYNVLDNTQKNVLHEKWKKFPNIFGLFLQALEVFEVSSQKT